MRLLSSTHIYLLTFLLYGCATYNPSDYYDPNATEKIGRISLKSVARHETRQAADNPIIAPVPGLIPYGTTLILQKSLRRDSQIPIYSYTIKTEDQSEVIILSEFPSHSVGDCVKVFLSTRPDYPRMAVWSGCKQHQ
jgi:hypothetical protein